MKGEIEGGLKRIQKRGCRFFLMAQNGGWRYCELLNDFQFFSKFVSLNRLQNFFRLFILFVDSTQQSFDLRSIQFNRSVIIFTIQR